MRVKALVVLLGEGGVGFFELRLCIGVQLVQALVDDAVLGEPLDAVVVHVPHVLGHLVGRAVYCLANLGGIAFPLGVLRGGLDQHEAGRDGAGAHEHLDARARLRVDDGRVIHVADPRLGVGHRVAVHARLGVALPVQHAEAGEGTEHLRIHQVVERSADAVEDDDGRLFGAGGDELLQRVVLGAGDAQVRSIVDGARLGGDVVRGQVGGPVIAVSGQRGHAGELELAAAVHLFDHRAANAHVGLIAVVNHGQAAGHFLVRDERPARVELHHAALQLGEAAGERHPREVGRVGDGQRQVFLGQRVVVVVQHVVVEGRQQARLPPQVVDADLLWGVERGVYVGAGVVCGDEAHADRAGHGDRLMVEGDLAGDEVAPVLARDRVDAVSEELFGIAADDRLHDLLGVLALDAGKVGELPLDVLAEVVVHALVEEADARRLAAQVQAGKDVDLLLLLLGLRLQRQEADDAADEENADQAAGHLAEDARTPEATQNAEGRVAEDEEDDDLADGRRLVACPGVEALFDRGQFVLGEVLLHVGADALERHMVGTGGEEQDRALGVALGVQLGQLDLSGHAAGDLGARRHVRHYRHRVVIGLDDDDLVLKLGVGSLYPADDVAHRPLRPEDLGVEAGGRAGAFGVLGNQGIAVAGDLVVRPDRVRVLAGDPEARDGQRDADELSLGLAALRALRLHEKDRLGAQARCVQPLLARVEVHHHDRVFDRLAVEVGQLAGAHVDDRGGKASLLGGGEFARLHLVGPERVERVADAAHFHPRAQRGEGLRKRAGDQHPVQADELFPLRAPRQQLLRLGRQSDAGEERRAVEASLFGQPVQVAGEKRLHQAEVGLHGDPCLLTLVLGLDEGLSVSARVVGVGSLVDVDVHLVEALVIGDGLQAHGDGRLGRRGEFAPEVAGERE